jgi:hypothetical protein
MRFDLAVEPTKQSLSDAFGFAVPSALVEIILIAWRECNSEDDISCFYDDAFGGFWFGAAELRYTQTPAELFPVGTMGVDGVHYGYVVHAPELDQSDYPMGELCPMDEGGVFLLGTNTIDGFSNLLSDPLDYAELDEESIRRIKLLGERLGVCLEPGESAARYGPDGNGIAIVPAVPEGWHHLQTMDGIGVLAPRDQFEDRAILATDRYRTPWQHYVSAAEQASRRGFHGTALAYVREAYWRHWTDDGARGSLIGRMAEEYAALGRPSLADVITNYVEKWG